MIASVLLASLGLLGMATAGITRRNFDCGTDTAHASTDFMSALEALHTGNPPKASSGSPAARAAALFARDSKNRPSKNNNTAIQIDVVFHIVATSANKGSITNDMPRAQLDALNSAYNPYGISYDLKNVTWNTNDKWAVGVTADDMEMKKSLRQGTYSTLNIYFQTDLAGGVLGRCTLPSSLSNGRSTDPKVYVSDGCNINANTMPDGDLEDYNSGKTAVHETGHWLGLLHTFEGNSCDGPGDYIDDTPYEKEATDGCPTSPPKSTCPNQPGQTKDDPIHNYMDYSTDECYEGFTHLQHDRMHYMFNMFRDGN